MEVKEEIEKIEEFQKFIILEMYPETCPNILCIPIQIWKSLASLNLLKTGLPSTFSSGLACYFCQKYRNTKATNCGHNICISCYLKAVDDSSKSSFLKMNDVTCPNNECSKNIDPQNIFNCIESFKQLAIKYRKNPFKKLTYSCISCGSKTFKVEEIEGSRFFCCQQCKTEICTSCKYSHKGQKCDESKIQLQLEQSNMRKKSTLDSFDLLSKTTICPFCEQFYHKQGNGCNSMKCEKLFESEKKTKYWCFLCKSEVKDDAGSNHWPSIGMNSFSYICPNFPLKMCPNISCKQKTGRQGKNNIISCKSCKKTWCFLCQQLKSTEELKNHFYLDEDSKSIDYMCKSFPTRDCPYCNQNDSNHWPKQGYILCQCFLDLSKTYCYICGKKFQDQGDISKIGKHFLNYGLYSLHCKKNPQNHH